MWIFFLRNAINKGAKSASFDDVGECSLSQTVGYSVKQINYSQKSFSPSLQTTSVHGQFHRIDFRGQRLNLHAQYLFVKLVPPPHDGADCLNR